MKKYKYFPVFRNLNAKLRSYRKELECIMSLKGMSDIQVMKAICEYRIASETNMDAKVGWYTVKTALGLEMGRHLTHYFIQDDSLVDFLSQTTFNFESLKSLVRDKGIVSDSEQTVYIPVCIHTKNFGYFFSVNYYVGEDKYGVMYLDDNHGADKFEIKHCMLSETVFEDKTLTMLANLIFYIYAFPDCIRDGVPNDYIVTSVGSVKNRVINVSGKILSKKSTEKCPHFRSGHFRHYPADSEHWVNVRGQIRFIEGTFVKGRAKTVESNPQIA